LLAQARQLTNGTAYGNRFDIYDLTNDLKMHLRELAFSTMLSTKPSPLDARSVTSSPGHGRAVLG
jgi:hypothetical protein